MNKTIPWIKGLFKFDIEKAHGLLKKVLSLFRGLSSYSVHHNDIIMEAKPQLSKYADLL